MNERRGIAVGRCDHVDFLVIVTQGLFENNGEVCARSGGNVCRFRQYGIGCDHARTHVSFGGTANDARFEIACGVEPFCALLGERACVFTCDHDGREKRFEINVDALGLQKCVEVRKHFFIVIVACNGEHTRSIVYAERLFARQSVMNVACKRGQKGDVFYVGQSVENGFVILGNRPTHGYVEAEQLRQLACGSGGIRVSPRAEGGEQSVILVKCEVAVHHARNADGIHGREHLTVIADQIAVAFLQAALRFLEGVGPESVHEFVFPFVRALRENVCFFVDQHGFDSRGSKFDTKNFFHKSSFRKKKFRLLPL